MHLANQVAPTDGVDSSTPGRQASSKRLGASISRRGDAFLDMGTSGRPSQHASAVPDHAGDKPALPARQASQKARTPPHAPPGHEGVASSNARRTSLENARRSLDAQQEAWVAEGGAKKVHLRSFASAKVAGASDRETLSSASKHDIHSVKVLGEGAFGIVDLVAVDTGSTQLLCVRKKLLKASDKNNNDPAKEVELLVAAEGLSLVMQMWSHVVGLYDYTLLLEYCPYGNLDSLLQIVSAVRSTPTNMCWAFMSDKVLKLERRAGFSEEEARFYMACAFMGLQQLHERRILHRDIKPSNCLIADNCYVKLCDLGLAKQLVEEGKAYSHVGTPGYMAPEVLHSNGKGGYSYPADIWSMGMMLWELVDGTLPKWAAMSWYWTSLHFPEKFSNTLRSLLTGLLEKNPKDRLLLPDIMRHPWFEGMDWEGLAEQRLTAPKPLELEEVHIHSRLDKMIGLVNAAAADS